MSAFTNKIIMQLLRRAEGSSPSILVRTFVDTGSLFTILNSFDHQIMYGRRGSGKSHAMIYLQQKREEANDFPIYIDMRIIGSTSGIYSDASISLAERATRLIMDTLSKIHEELLQVGIEHAEEINLSVFGPMLDRLAAAITEVVVVGETTVGSKSTESAQTARGYETSINVSHSGIRAGITERNSITNEKGVEQNISATGNIIHRVNFGSVGSCLAEISRHIQPHRIWVLIDEWSVVPIDLQPLLADLIRRTLLPARGCVVKIAAIEHRSKFASFSERGDYTGIELGTDIAADINLDDFMVFDNNAERSIAFFKNLLYAHFIAIIEHSYPENTATFSTVDDFLRESFSQQTALIELVKAAEGIPRDAINILMLAAQRAIDQAITTENIRSAAKDWFQRDKDAATSANAKARELLEYIISEIIGHRRARAFLVKSNVKSRLLDILYDNRVLHILKRNISSPEAPGIRYRAYKIDYGCYVDILSTSRAPRGLLQTDEMDGDISKYIDVPPDDYRAIRRAILDLEALPPALLQ